VFAASEARAAGWGGVAAVAEITGLARSRIIRAEINFNRYFYRYKHEGTAFTVLTEKR
jgi:hypothetical protein